MSDTRKTIPAAAVELYTRFVHGEIDRRAFVAGVGRYAAAGLTASVILDALMPDYAQAQQVRRDDERLSAAYVTLPSPDGHGVVRGYLVRPSSADTRSATPSKLPGVIVIHENRGLNPHTEDVARRFALENFMAFAPDALTSVGGYPGDDYKGGQLFASLDRAKVTQDLVAAARWLKARDDCNGKIAATGFCFGGAQTNLLAALLGDDLAAGAPFYGAATPVDQVGDIRAAMLLHHGDRDTALAAAYPAQIAELERHGVRHEGHLWPNSVHGFFNDATPERYNRETATEAWDRTLAWFNRFTRP